MTNPIFKGDDTGAFGNNFITINIQNPNNYVISQAEFVINGGCPKLKPVKNPTFPMVVNFTSEQTAQFRANNIGNLVVWDEQNRQKQCKGYIEFKAENGAICSVRRYCC